MDEPWDVADAFVAALAAGNESAAAACCTADAWIAEADSPARLFGQVAERGFVVEAGEVERTDGRAAAVLEVSNPERPNKKRVVTALLAEGHDGWQIDGLSLGELHVNAFLGGAVAARPCLEPADGAALLDRATTEGRVGRRFRLRIDQLTEAGGTWRIVEAGRVAGLERARLHVRSTPADGEPGDAWIVIDAETGRVLAEDSFPSWGSLFLSEEAEEPEDDDIGLPPE